MQFLAHLRAAPGTDPVDGVASVADMELKVLWSLYTAGVVREMYSVPGMGAVLMLEAASEAEARDALEELPLVSRGVMEVELTELRPFRAFQMLFDPRPGRLDPHG